VESGDSDSNILDRYVSEESELPRGFTSVDIQDEEGLPSEKNLMLT